MTHSAHYTKLILLVNRWLVKKNHAFSARKKGYRNAPEKFADTGKSSTKIAFFQMKSNEKTVLAE